MNITKHISNFYWNAENLHIEVADASDERHKVLKIDDDMFFMRVDQLEKLEEILEKNLYDESCWRVHLDEKLISAEVEIERLQDKVDELEGIVENLKYGYGRAI